MSAFKTVFANKPRVFLPVIHCKHSDQVWRNADVAMRGGADGIFLINQGGMYVGDILDHASKLADDLQFVGINLLGRNIEEVQFVAAKHHLDGFWTDYIDQKRIETHALYFGGAAFKYGRPVANSNLGAVAREAAQKGADVVTTSGPGTGQAPTAEKIKAMSEALEGHPLAIASGITPENVDPFLPYAQAFLVATGIEKEFGEFDADRLKKLADKIHAL